MRRILDSMAAALEALHELRDLGRQAVVELRAIKRAANAQRPYLTRNQARRLLQMDDDSADALLDRIGAVKMVDGRERIFADDLLSELQARLDPVMPAPARPPLLNPRMARADAFAGRRRPGKLQR